MQKRVATTKTVFIEIILKPSLNNWNKSIIFKKNSPQCNLFSKGYVLPLEPTTIMKIRAIYPQEAELIKKVKAGLNVFNEQRFKRPFESGEIVQEVNFNNFNYGISGYLSFPYLVTIQGKLILLLYLLIRLICCIIYL